MVASVLPQGTKTKTPEELEEDIELLGSISICTEAEKKCHSAQVCFQGTLKRRFAHERDPSRTTLGLSRIAMARTRTKTVSFRLKLSLEA